VSELRDQLMLYVGIMAVAWLLDVPALIRSRFGEAARSLSRNDSLIKDGESVPRAAADAHQCAETLGENAFRRPTYYCHDGLVVSTSGPPSVMTIVSRCSTAPTPSCHT
jgi:hypothetical protein